MAFSYEFYAVTSANKEVAEIKVLSFDVIGGAGGPVNVDSADDVSIGTRFGQARKHKNIVLITSATGGPVTVENAMRLTKYASEKSTFNFHLVARQFNSQKMIFGMSLSDDKASVRKYPIIDSGNYLRVEIALPNGRIVNTSAA